MDLFDSFREIMLGTILGVDDENLRRARQLAEVHAGLDARDALHVV